MGSNSKIYLRSNTYTGDIDADGIDEFIEIDGRHLYVFKAEFDHTPVLEHVFPHVVKRLVIGDFSNSGRERNGDHVLALLDDGSARCYAVSDDKTKLWWWFTQDSFISKNEEYVVADFDGDGEEEILVYRPSNGQTKMYKKDDMNFKQVSEYKPGNLNAGAVKNKILLAGNFGQSRYSQDIIAIDNKYGRVARYDSVSHEGKRTFWWSFTSDKNIFSSKDDIVTANLDGSTKDGLIIRSHVSGQYRFLKVEFGDGNLSQLSDVDSGQLPVRAKKGKIIPSLVRNKSFRKEKGGTRRHDVLYFNPDSLEIIRTDARYDKTNSRMTYWRAYNSYNAFEPVRHSANHEWLVMLCRFKGDNNDYPDVESYFKEIFTPGSGGLVEYWHDVSLGALDISRSRVVGWIELEIERKDACKYKRDQLVGKAMLSCIKKGISFKHIDSYIAVFTHNFSVDGAPAGADYHDPVWGEYWIDGSCKGKFISAPPHIYHGTTVAHEMGHTIGLKHDLKPNMQEGYGDPYCLMSADHVFNFKITKWNKYFGPGLSFPQLMLKGWMFERRIYNLDRYWTENSKKVSCTLAPLFDRRLNAYLGMTVPVDTSNSWCYYLEYVTPVNWNKGFDAKYLIIRRMYKNQAVFLDKIQVPKYMKQIHKWVDSSTGITIQVKKIRQDDRFVQVSVVAN